MPNELTIYEAENAKVQFALTYSTTWSVAAKRGTNVAQGDVSVVYFYAKTLRSDASAWLTLTDASASQISWSGNVVTVHFPASTEGQAGDEQFWELRIKWSDGTWTTASEGVLNVINSIVDTP